MLAWGLRRQVAGSKTEELIAAIDVEFHTTLDNDEKIATTLRARGMATSARQIKKIRLQQGWKHRTHDTTEREALQAQTTSDVAEAITEGTGRAYGRSMMYTHLRVNHGIRARDRDVGIAPVC
jgi:hypothetical protein